MFQRKSIFEESVLPDYTGWVELQANDFIVLSDVESPGYDHNILDMVYHMGSELGINTLILGGDFIANDSFSKWARMTRTATPFRDELQPTIKIINKLSEPFTVIKWICGNHERRLTYQVDGEFTIGDLIQHETDAEFSEYAHCYVHSGGRKTMVVHQDNYSKVPLSIPYEMAAINLCDMACTHTHRLAQGWDRSNTFQIAECGYGRALSKTHYKMLRKNRMPEWNHGFLLVMDGIFQTVNPYNFELIMRQGVGTLQEPQPLYPPEVLEMAAKLVALKEGAA